MLGTCMVIHRRWCLLRFQRIRRDEDRKREEKVMLVRDANEKVGWRRAEKSPRATFFQRWKYRYTLISVGESNYCRLGRSVREDRDAKRGESSNHGVRAIVWPSQHEGSLRIPSANFPFEDLSACRYPPGQQEVVHPWPSSPWDLPLTTFQDSRLNDESIRLDDLTVKAIVQGPVNSLLTSR